MNDSVQGLRRTAWSVVAVVLAVAVPAAVAAAVLLPSAPTSGGMTVDRDGPVIVGSPTQRDLAGWTATPIPGAASTASLRRCAAGSNDEPAAAPAPDPAALSETRGSITAIIMRTRSGPRLCLLVRDRLLLFRGLADADGSGRGVTRSAVGGGLVDHVDHVSLGFVAGRTSPATVALTAEVPDLPTVDASVGSGWFVLWWPRSTPADLVRLHCRPARSLRRC